MSRLALSEAEVLYAPELADVPVQASAGTLEDLTLPAVLLAVGAALGAILAISRAANAPDPDPGRPALSGEWASGGRVILDLALDASGSLQVTAHSASQLEALPPGVPAGSWQEWRVLRFVPASGRSNLVQSVAKVCMPPPAGDTTLQVRMRADCLALEYSKSFVAVALATLSVLGAPLSPSKSDGRQLRILCIGLGGGSVPSFLAETLPHCSVEVAELEPAVLQAATEALGFQQRPNLRVAVEDGSTYALRAAEAAAAQADGVYDAVLIDAYDAAGNVPLPLRSADGDLAAALSRGLLRARGGLIATNLLVQADPAAVVAAHKTALASRAGVGFSVQAPGPGNYITVQTSAAADPASPAPVELRGELMRAARELQAAIGCPWDMEALVARNLQEWRGSSKDKDRA